MVGDRRESESVRRSAVYRQTDNDGDSMYAADIMRAVPTLRAEISWRDAVHLLLGNALDAAPVVDTDDRVIGIITQTDLATRTTGLERTELRAILDGVITIRSHRTLLRWHESPHWETGSTVAALMTASVVTVRPDTPIAVVARTLLDHDIAQVPVTDSTMHLAGIVRQRDIVAAVAMWGASLFPPPAERDAFAAWAAS
jgi:CBS domain-containing protein